MAERRYVGFQNVWGSFVYVEDDSTPLGRRNLPLRLDLINHSPTGFAWGYGGSGPAQLALAILAEALDDDRAMDLYQDFKWLIVARLPKDQNWHLTTREIEDAIVAIKIARECAIEREPA